MLPHICYNIISILIYGLDIPLDIDSQSMPGTTAYTPPFLELHWTGHTTCGVTWSNHTYLETGSLLHLGLLICLLNELSFHGLHGSLIIYSSVPGFVTVTSNDESKLSFTEQVKMS